MNIREMIEQYQAGAFSSDIVKALEKKRSELRAAKAQAKEAFHATCSAYLDDVYQREKLLKDRIAQLEKDIEKAQGEASETMGEVARAVAERNGAKADQMRQKAAKCIESKTLLEMEREALNGSGTPGDDKCYAEVIAALESAIAAVKKHDTEVGQIYALAREQRDMWGKLLPADHPGAGVYYIPKSDIDLLEQDRQLKKVREHYQSHNA